MFLKLKKLLLMLQVFVLFVMVSFTLKYYGLEKALFLAKNEYRLFGNDNFSRNLLAVNLTSRLLPFCSCLVRSIVLKILCSKFKNLELVIGVSKAPNFESHAWIEKDGRIIFGETDDQEKYSKILGTY